MTENQSNVVISRDNMHQSSIDGLAYSIKIKGSTRIFWIELIKRQEHLVVFYLLMLDTIDSCLYERFENFDAQTTTNCCHGLSILAKNLIKLSCTLNLKSMRSKLVEFMNVYSRPNNTCSIQSFIASLPGELLDLLGIRTITYTMEFHPDLGRKTSPLRLKILSNVGTKFCTELTKKLQRKIANLVAESYSFYLSQMPNYEWLNHTRIYSWGKYVRNPHLRVDKKNVMYASCLFSMQVSIAFLLHTNSMIALVSDIIDCKTKNTHERFVSFLSKNQVGRLMPISLDDVLPQHELEPIVVFGGFSFVNKQEIPKLLTLLESWSRNFPSLILACDTHYPQFPKVADDNNFCSTPIQPREPGIIKTLEQLKNVQGVSALDSRLFCLSHIFLSSYSTLKSVYLKSNTHALQCCYLPCLPLKRALKKKSALGN